MTVGLLSVPSDWNFDKLNNKYFLLVDFHASLSQPLAFQNNQNPQHYQKSNLWAGRGFRFNSMKYSKN